MQVFIASSHTELFKDFYDILKIFIFDLSLSMKNPEDNYDMYINFIENSYDEVHYIEFSTVYHDKKYLSKNNRHILNNSPLEFKKEYKKLIKITLYKLLKSIFGKKSPWGSLTGVRPTYLMYESLHKFGFLELAEDYLKNEYDVDASKVLLLSDIVKTQSKLPIPKKNEIDVYIGIPFCTSRCSYCTFASNAIKKSSIDSYLKALFYEIETVKKIIVDNCLNIRAMYIGGGTPTALDDQSFKLLLEFINKTFENYKEFEYTVEAGRPDTINEYKLKCMKESGVNRISINPQTLNDSTLKLIGRNHSSKDFFIKYDLARKLNFDNINTDVISALPGENFEDFKHTIDSLIDINPDSITVHTLAFKKNSILSNSNNIISIDNNTTEEMVNYARLQIMENNYLPYYLYRQKNISSHLENVAYAKRYKECLYNIDMMEERLSVLAVGAGSISKLVYEEKNSYIKRAANVSDLNTYIKNINIMCNRKIELFNARREFH